MASERRFSVIDEHGIVRSVGSVGREDERARPRRRRRGSNVAVQCACLPVIGCLLYAAVTLWQEGTSVAGAVSLLLAEGAAIALVVGALAFRESIDG